MVMIGMQDKVRGGNEGRMTRDQGALGLRQAVAE